MAYEEKYYAQWKDYGGTIHEIKLLQDGASAGSTEIAVVQTVPYTHNIRGSKDAPIKSQIFGSEITFNFVISSAGISGIDDIFESEYREWKVEHYYDSALDWVGWVQPNNYSRIYVSKGDYYLISLSAVDGLANLKDIEFVDFTTGEQYEDRVSIIQTIKRALEHVNIALDFRIAVNTWCSNDSLMFSTDCTLDKVTCDSRRFTKTEEGRIVNTNCYEVITELLEPFNSHLIQSQGEYWIVIAKDYFPTVFKILWTTLAIDSNSLVDMRTDITGAETKQLRTRGEVQKIKPLKTVEISFRDRNVGDNLLSNGDFSNGTTNWTNVGYTSFNVVSEEGRLEYVTDNDTGAYLKYADIAITPTGEDDYIALELDCKLITASYEPLGDDRPPRIQIQLYTAAGAHVGSSTLKSLSDDWAKLTAQIAISEVTNYQIRIYIIEHPTSWVTASITAIDNVRAVAIYQSADITFDRHFKVTNIVSVYTGVEKIELNFGDSTGDSDIAAFKISGTRTKTWNNWAQTDENISINILAAQNIIEDYAQYKDYLRLVIVDNYYNDTPRIFPHRLLVISGSYYRVVSQTATYAALSRKEIEVELIRVLRTSVNTSVIQSTLSTVDGNSSSQEIAVPVSGGVTDHGQLTGLADDDHPQYDKVISFSKGVSRTLNAVILTPIVSTVHVGSLGDDTTGDGHYFNPYLTLQKAHDVASPGDTIRIVGKWNSYATTEDPTFTKTLYIDGRESAAADLTGTITLSGSLVLTLIDFQVFGKVLGGTTGYITLQGKSLIFSKGSTCFQLNIEDHSKMNLEDVVVDDKLEITGGVCTGVGTITCDYFIINTSYVPNSISASSVTKDCTLTNSFVGGNVDTDHDLIQRNSVILGTVTVASGGVHIIQNQGEDAVPLYLTWYVDDINGLDTNDGLFPESAVKTLQKAYDLRVLAGDPTVLATIHILTSATYAGLTVSSLYATRIVAQNDQTRLGNITVNNGCWLEFYNCNTDAFVIAQTGTNQIYLVFVNCNTAGDAYGITGTAADPLYIYVILRDGSILKFKSTTPGGYYQANTGSIIDIGGTCTIDSITLYDSSLSGLGSGGVTLTTGSLRADRSSVALLPNSYIIVTGTFTKRLVAFVRPENITVNGTEETGYIGTWKRKDPNVWHVSASGSNTAGNGTPEYPYLTLQEAHDNAAAYDIIKIINAQDGSFFPSESPTFTKSLTIDGRGDLGSAIFDLVGIVGNITLTGTTNLTLLGFYVLGKIIGGTTGSVYLFNMSTISEPGTTVKNLRSREHSVINLQSVVVDNNLEIDSSNCTGGGDVTCAIFVVKDSSLTNNIESTAGAGVCVLLNSFIKGTVDVTNELWQQNSVIVGAVTLASGATHTVENQIAGGLGMTLNNRDLDLGDLDPSAEMRISTPEVSGVATKGIKWWLDPVNGSAKMQAFEYDGTLLDREVADHSSYIDGNGDALAEMWAVRVKTGGYNAMIRAHLGYISVGDLWSGGDTGSFKGLRYHSYYTTKVAWTTDDLLVPHQKRVRELVEEQTVKVTLTQAQIQALNTTPIEVIAAPGAGEVIEVISATVKNKFNTAAFATATYIYLMYASGSENWKSTTSFIQDTADRYERMQAAAAYLSPDQTALQVSADADATAGNAASVFEIYVKYRIVDTT